MLVLCNFHACSFIRFSQIMFEIYFVYCVYVAFVLMYGSGLGVTMGAHRLWSHRSFKAKTPLKIFLLWLHTLAGQVRYKSYCFAIFIGQYFLFAC